MIRTAAALSLAALLLAPAAPPAAPPGVHTETVEYKVGASTMKSFFAAPDGATKKPAVVVFPEWWGVNDYAKRRAEELASIGYVALAADMYGDGFVTTDAKEATKRVGAVKGDAALWRARADAAIAALKARKEVDPERIAAIGYCFGGSTCLVLAAANAPLRGVVSFHGNFPNAAMEGDAPIAPKVLVCHGGADTFVSPEERTKFMEILKRRKADWEFIEFADATHSFTNKDADAFKIPGISYNAKADARSWEAMKAFFAEALR